MSEPKNIKVKVKENMLILKINLDKDYGESKSGKSNIVATTGGFYEVEAASDWGQIGLNLNLTKKITKKKKKSREEDEEDDD